MSVRTVTRDLEVVAEGDRGSLTIFLDQINAEKIPYSSFLVKFVLKSGPG